MDERAGMANIIRRSPEVSRFGPSKVPADTTTIDLRRSGLSCMISDMSSITLMLFPVTAYAELVIVPLRAGTTLQMTSSGPQELRSQLSKLNFGVDAGRRGGLRWPKRFELSQHYLSHRNECGSPCTKRV